MSAETQVPDSRISLSTQHYEWLRREASRWAAGGIVTPEQSDRIVESYAPVGNRFSLTRLLLTLGGVFVGIGVIWLVAANLDRFSPLLRFAVVAACWLAATIGSEWLSTRPAHRSATHSPLVAMVRLLAALLLGAVIFQAAQSLQVPAYEPKLLGCWALGALVFAYATRAFGPLVIGVAAGSAFFVWQVARVTQEATSGLLAVAMLGVIGVSLGVLHRHWSPTYAALWREVGAAFALGGLFFAGIPFIESERFAPSWTLLVGLFVAVVLAVSAIVRSDGWRRVEPVIALLAAGVGFVLIRWNTDTDLDKVGFEDWAHAVIAVVAYVGLALAVAVGGILHDSWRLTLLATGALVAFTTFQSFAVFGQIVTGAWLFLLLGLVLVGTGWGFDRTRRRLAASIEEETVR